MAKILFVNPIVREEDNPKHVPYGIALLASICVNEGHQVQIYDHNAWRQSDRVIREVMRADDWDLIATGGITTSYRSMKKIAKFARQECPDSLIVAGGGGLTATPMEYMQLVPEYDLGVVGEAFATFPEVAKKAERGEEDWEGTLGVIWRKKSGETVLNDSRPLIPELDALPYPAYEMLPLEEVYFPNSRLLFSEEAFTSKRRLDINGSIGCSLVCRFCYHLGIAGDLEILQKADGTRDVGFDRPGHYTRNIRWHSPRYIVDLVKHARERYGVDFIGFLDENMMTMDKYSGGVWLREICERWIDAGLQPTCRAKGIPHDRDCEGVHWNGTSHAQLVNPKVLKLMHFSGCASLIYGLESFNKRTLGLIGKASTVQANERALKWTTEAGIRPIPNLILGFPEEDFDSIRDNMNAMIRLGIRSRPHFCTPYPGSEWFWRYREKILEQYGGDFEAFLEDLGDASRVTAVICHKFTGAELYGLREIMVTGNFRLLDKYEEQRGRLDKLAGQGRQNLIAGAPAGEGAGESGSKAIVLETASTKPGS
jgi:radical SAM superfamily enzyme YgiQ (UPF0313 family)